MRTIKLALSVLALLPLSACGTSEATAPAAPALAIGETGKANGIEVAVTSVMFPVSTYGPDLRL